ncbi:MAG: primosomal protein N' [Candidatus Omnitrophica bacterium]|nr:primosomal protein N' [Candidatus Omnitrophota bacterium]
MKNALHEFADLAINIPVDRLFTYGIPADTAKKAEVGKRAFVDFRNKETVGYIVGFRPEAEAQGIKEIRSVIDDEPVISGELLKLTERVSLTYLCSYGQAIAAAIPGVLKKGKVSVKSREKHEEEKMPAPSYPLALTDEQKKVLESVFKKIDMESYRPFLLHGITASGKTEIYLQAIEKVLNKGKTSIVLVPEIALTPQTVERFTSRFGSKVAVAHSALVGSMRYKEWQRIRSGEAKIVVGARSAIFSPVRNLGLIIIDEEHETSYKQEDVPRYHARDVALMRAKLANCPVILGSATPSLESFYLAKKGELEMVKLTKRIDERSLPKTKVVDMRMELATRKKVCMFSKVLVDSIERVLKDGRQVMIFLNRRGFSTYVNCKRCGLVLKCKKCDSVMVYHYETRNLICHYCNFRMPPPDICPKCNAAYMKYFGIGTEKVESEIARLFPQARIARMDTDATAKRGSHDRILGEFKKHNIDILVGTQMIAKGLDFPRVTLVGVVNADVTLNLPDFRASERTFNLLTQVAGRAGRGEDGGEVIIQTYAPEHYAILAASKHDYEKFYAQEIKSRKELFFPPFVHLIKLTLRSRNEKSASDAAGSLKEFLEKNLFNTEKEKSVDKIDIAGPAPSPIARVRGFFRWNVLLKGRNRTTMCETLRGALRSYRKPAGVILTIDVDPMSM